MVILQPHKLPPLWHVRTYVHREFIATSKRVGLKEYRNPKCMGYTWNLCGPVYTCWLKTFIPASTGNNCRMMGVITPMNITINNQPCSLINMTAKLIYCTFPPGAGTNLSLNLTVAGQSTTINYSYPIPIITSATSIATTGGNIIIMGSYFGGSASDLNVTVNGSICNNIVWTNASYITCNISPGTGYNLPVLVIAGGQSGRANVYSYLPPSITSISQSDTNGGPVTLIGTNFGTDPGAIIILINGQQCTGNIIITPHTSINCTVAPGVGSNLTVSVTVNSQTATSNIFNYNIPVVLLTTSVSTDGGTITITGRNFGPMGTTASVIINNQPCTNSIVQSHTTMTCIIYPGTGANNPLQLSVGGQASQNILYSYLPPIVTSIDRGVTEGSVIRFTGSNFGTNFQKITVSINGGSCAFISVTNSSLFQCTVAPGVGGALPVAVNVDGLLFSNATGYSYLAPTISSINTIGTMGGLITINGNNFGNDSSLVSITIGGQSCSGIYLIPNYIQCTFIPGMTGYANLIMTVGNQGLIYRYAFAAPTVRNVTIIPTIGGMIYITADDLGTVQGDISVTKCTALTLNNNTVSCNMTGGSGGSVSADLTVNGRTTTFKYGYIPPSIISISQPPTSGGIIVISGSNFATTTLVRVSSVLCSSISVAANLSIITCSVGVGVGSVPVTINAGGQTSTSSMYYQSPYVAWTNSLSTAGG